MQYHTLEVKKGPYLPENDPKRASASGASRKTVLREVQNTTDERTEMESKSFSNASKIDFKPLSNTQQYNIPSEQDKALNKPGGLLRLPNFITLSKISEQEKIEIIQKGFQLQAQRKLSLKQYYESTDPYSLFQLKGYSIKYESIRRTKLYQQLKE